MTNRRKRLRAGTIIALAGLAAVFAGCRDDEQPKAEEPQAETDPVKRRMADKAYVGKLDKQLEQQRDIMGEITAARAAFDKAKAAGAPEEELAKLSNAVVKCYMDLEQNRVKSQKIVRDKMWSDAREHGDLNMLQQKKGN